MKALLLGAGASRGTFDDDFCVPVCHEFGKTLAKLDPHWKQQYPALLHLVEHLDLNEADWPLEPVWTCLDYYAKLRPALPCRIPWRDGSRQIKKAILTVYGRRCDTACVNVKRRATLAGLLRQLRAGDVMISLNYDTIAEHLARKCGKRLSTVYHHRGHGVILVKPHGSTSWSLNLRGRRSAIWRSKHGTPLLRSLHARDVDSVTNRLSLEPCRSRAN